MDSIFGKMQRSEKRESHDVVPMGMGENEMILLMGFFAQLIAAASNAGSGIN